MNIYTRAGHLNEVVTISTVTSRTFLFDLLRFFILKLRHFVESNSEIEGASIKEYL